VPQEVVNRLGVVDIRNDCAAITGLRRVRSEASTRLRKETGSTDADTHAGTGDIPGQTLSRF